MIRKGRLKYCFKTRKSMIKDIDFVCDEYEKLRKALSNIKWRFENTIITKKEVIDIVNKALGSKEDE